MERHFVRGKKNNSYSNEEKRKLAELVDKLKGDYDAAVEANAGKTKYCERRGKLVPDLPKKDYLSCAVRSFYTDMRHRNWDDREFKMACKTASRAFARLSALADSAVRPPKKKRASGGGRKRAAPEVRTN